MDTIGKIIGTYEKSTYAERATQNHRVDKNEGGDLPPGKKNSTDSVSLSLTAKEMHIARELVMSKMEDSPSGQEMKIDLITRAIRQGDYKIDFDEVSRKMLLSTQDTMEV